MACAMRPIPMPSEIERAMEGDLVLEIKGLKAWFDTGREIVRAVDDIDLKIHRGKTLCLVGESGSGKSITARAILQILPKPGRIIGGEILLRGSDQPWA